MENVIATRQLRFEAEESDGRTLVGLAVPFNEPTRIDNPMEGTFDEQFLPGAFKRSLGLRTPVLQFDHGTHPMIGSLPIGEFRHITETKRGLEVEARIFDAELFAPLREALATSAIDGMSIRFRPVRIDLDPTGGADGVRMESIEEADLLELGPVIFPAYAGTTVDLRSLDLTRKIDRHRLAEALLSGVSLAGHGSDQTDEPGTDPEAGSPATKSDQVSRHSDSAPHKQRLQRRREFHQRWMSKN